MEMWLNLFTLMFLTAVAGMAISGEILVILDETQKKLDVPLGSSLALHCNLRTEKYHRFRVSWYMNSFGSSFNDSQPIFTKVIDRYKNQTGKTKLNLKNEERDSNKTRILSNVTQENSGWYFCKVTGEIPMHRCSSSNGTQINILTNLQENATFPSLVTSKQVNPPDKDQDINWWMWILLGISSFILLVLLALCVLLRRRCRRSRAPDPIYINTRPMVSKQPSPRPAMPVDKLNAATSSQDLRAPSPGKRYEESRRKQMQ